MFSRHRPPSPGRNVSFEKEPGDKANLLDRTSLLPFELALVESINKEDGHTLSHMIVGLFCGSRRSGVFIREDLKDWHLG